MERDGPIQAAEVADADSALASGDWVAAGPAFEALVREHPDHIEFRYKLARAYEGAGRFQDAALALDDPMLAGREQTSRMLASIFMNAKDYESALPVVEDLLAGDPANEKLGKWKARCEEKIRGRRLSQLMKEAKALASADRLDEAAQAYLSLLLEFPDSAEAHGRLAQIYVLQRCWNDAIAPFQAALAMEPANRDHSTGLARALFKSGDPTQAALILERLDQNPEDQDVLLLQQRCYTELQDWPRVAAAGARLLHLLPAGDPIRAEIASTREDALVELELARIRPLAEAGRLQEAAAAYEKIAERFPASAVGWLKLGTVLADAERIGEAASALRRALHLRSDDAAIRRSLTRVMLRLGDEDEVLRYVKQADAEQTADGDCYRWLARYRAGQKAWPLSLEASDKALAIEPDSGAARLLRARALVELGQWAEALNELELLVPTDLKPAEVLRLKADVLVELGRAEDSIAFYRAALEKAPKDPLISYKLSQASLSSGDIESFHRFHERRRELPEFGQEHEEPPFYDWQGELCIEGKLLVWVEAGFGIGETILHLGFVKPLSALGLKIVLRVDPQLIDVCRRSFPDTVVVPNGGDLPGGISHHTPLGSLSRWFKPDLASFGSVEPYLIPDLELVAARRTALKQKAGAGRVMMGVALAGENTAGVGAASIDLAEIMRLVDPSAVALVDLQGDGPSAEAGSSELWLGGMDPVSSLDDLCAAVATMDLIVCVDSPIAHISGALGVPTMTILPTVPAAHWLAHGDRAIWYRDTALFRRASVDDGWNAVLDQVGKAVSEFVSVYDADDWLAGTVAPDLRPRSNPNGGLSDDQISDAVSAFVIQGASSQTAFRSALELIDRLPVGHRSQHVEVQRGDLLARFGRWEEAREVYLGLLPHESDDQELRQKVLSVSLAMHDLEHALLIARQLAVENPAYRVVAANILYHMREHEQALAELRLVSIKAPHTEGLSTLTGTLLLEMGQFQRAETFLSTQASVTRRAEDYTLLGRSVAAQGRLEEALVSYDKALGLSHADPAANFWATQARIDAGIVSLTALPPLLGEVPSVAPEDVVLMFAADNKFFWEHGLTLLGSVGTRSPEAHCHVHVIDPDDRVARTIKAVRERFPQLRLTYSYEHVEAVGRSNEYMRTYYASVRFVRLAEIFARAPACYFCVDADCIVRDDVAARVSRLNAGDVAIRMRYDERPHATVAAGGLVLRPTSGAATLIERVSRLISRSLEAGEATWFLDQIVLSHVVRELGGTEVKISQLEMGFIDWFFREESLVWTGKGHRKFLDQRYVSEVGQYQGLIANAESFSSESHVDR